MPALKQYSPSEISLHTSNEDCWLSIHGKVYDVTAFLGDHPGGEDVILRASAAGDATLEFDDVDHSATAMSMMEDFVIGTVKGYVSSSKPSKPITVPTGLQQKQPPPSNSFLLPLLALGFAFAAWLYSKVRA